MMRMMRLVKLRPENCVGSFTSLIVLILRRSLGWFRWTGQDSLSVPVMGFHLSF
jgi:hypothetical protein